MTVWLCVWPSHTSSVHRDIAEKDFREMIWAYQEMMADLKPDYIRRYLNTHT